MLCYSILLSTLIPKLGEFTSERAPAKTYIVLQTNHESTQLNIRLTKARVRSAAAPILVPLQTFVLLLLPPHGTLRAIKINRRSSGQGSGGADGLAAGLPIPESEGYTNSIARSNSV